MYILFSSWILHEIHVEFSQLSNDFFARLAPKISLVGVVLRAESRFSHTSAVIFPLWETSTSRTQNDTNWAKLKKEYAEYVPKLHHKFWLKLDGLFISELTSPYKSRVITSSIYCKFRYTANKKYRSYQVRNVFQRALALKYAFPHLIQ